MLAPAQRRLKKYILTDVLESENVHMTPQKG